MNSQRAVQKSYLISWRIIGWLGRDGTYEHQPSAPPPAFAKKKFFFIVILEAFCRRIRECLIAEVDMSTNNITLLYGP